MQKLAKILTIVLILSMAVSIVLTGLFYFGGIVPETIDSNFPEPIWTNQYLFWAKLLFGIGAIIAIIFPIISFVNTLIHNPKQAMRSVGGLVFFGLVIFIAYIVADDTVLNITEYKGSDNVASTLKMAGTSLYTMYFLGGIAIFAIILTEIMKVFK